MQTIITVLDVFNQTVFGPNDKNLKFLFGSVFSNLINFSAGIN